MPSNSFFVASAALLSMASAALVGTAPLGTAITNTAGSTVGSAKPTGYYPTSNGTTTAGAASPTASTSSNPDYLLCPGLNGEVFTDGQGHSYIISCGITYYGSFIDVDISINQTSKAKRATTNSLNTCMLACDDISDCVATSFNKDTGVCAFYSAIGAEYTDAIYDFAQVTSLTAAVTVVASGAPVTSGVLSTVTSTISSCAASITNCPYGAVETSVVVAYTTVCPCTVNGGCTVATAAACTSCSASVGTATVYSSTVVGGTTTVVPVATAEVAYPSGGATTNGATSTVTCTASACKAAATQTGVTAFTGAAASVKAGMGMVAIVAIAALAL